MSAKVLKRKRFQIENGFSQMEKRRSPRIQIQEAKKVNLFNREGTKKENLVKCEHQGKKKKKKKKSVPPNQISKGTCFSKKANLVKCQRQGKKKKKSVAPNQIRKGKRVVKQIDVYEQATEIHFQEQIIVEILSRLPVRSLLRFKCVSRIWEALIADPYFKMKHQSRHDSNSQKLLIRNCNITQDRLFEFYFHSSSLSTFEDVQQLDSPLSYKVDHYEIFSSFNGLVLLGADTQLLLWNPSTRESALLPHLEFNFGSTSFGLGCDDADGYKILKLDMLERQSIEILTLKSGCWRKICDYPTAVCPTMGYKMEINPNASRILPMDPLVYVHGAFHWLGHLGYTGKNFYAVSFSISIEVYGHVPLLEEMSTRGSHHIDPGLALLDGMLCFHGITTHGSLGTFKLWAMKEYGVKESWILLFTIQINHLYMAKPRYRFPDGDVLLYAPGVLPHQCGVTMFYIFQTSKGRFGFWPRRSFEKGIIYRESLISPKSVI